MDKITKALAALSKKERTWVKEILKKITKNDEKGLDIKKLKGRNDIFRARKARIRIIYRKTERGGIFILAVERRSERTYRNIGS
jgi:mRNA-degrading endonuclease RelE of RelBE toxin-antitoxin system